MKRMISGLIAVMVVVCATPSYSFRQSGNPVPGGSGGFPMAPQVPPPAVRVLKSESQLLKEFVNATGVTVVSHYNSSYKFSFGKGLIGIFVVYDDRSKLKKDHEEILEQNRVGYQFSWSFSKRGLLVILPPETSEEEARTFEDAIYNIRED
ncbi:MAG: hypothetical protein AB1499_01375 [Nitrospirota bacterium]